MKILPRKFYQRDTIEVAQDLLGKQIVRELDDGQIISGMIVETEAYTDYDEACHAFRGKTEANKALFGQVGHAYVYFIYGNHFCLKFVARSQESKSGGVLIRALEPLLGVDIMKRYRHVDKEINLTNGPGKLAQAFNITKKLYEIDITKKGPLYVTEYKKISLSMMCASRRIGISRSHEKEWRFFIGDNSFISRK